MYNFFNVSSIEISREKNFPKYHPVGGHTPIDWDHDLPSQPGRLGGSLANHPPADRLAYFVGVGAGLCFAFCDFWAVVHTAEGSDPHTEHDGHPQAHFRGTFRLECAPNHDWWRRVAPGRRGPAWAQYQPGGRFAGGGPPGGHDRHGAYAAFFDSRVDRIFAIPHTFSPSRQHGASVRQPAQTRISQGIG